jgi:penicillin-binding protein 2
MRKFLTSSGKTKLILILVILTIFLLLGLDVSVCGAEFPTGQFQKTCESFLGSNSGAIIVYDLKENRFLSVVNPEIAFRKAYKPGSFFKLITSVTLLEAKKIDTSQKFNCRNFFSVRGRNYTCSIPGGHGEQNLIDAISNSCNVYFYNCLRRLTHEEIKKTASLMGCGKILNHHGNTPLTIPGKCQPPEDPARFARFIVGDDEGIQITPWQAVNITAIIATGKPVSPDLPAPNLSPSTLDVIRKGMISASASGTCSYVSKQGISAACKTGTSTNFRNPSLYHGWFASYTPLNNPRYITVVFLEDGRGYSDAVPVGVKVMKALLTLMEGNSIR